MFTIAAYPVCLYNKKNSIIHINDEIASLIFLKVKQVITKLSSSVITIGTWKSVSFTAAFLLGREFMVQ